MRRAMVRAVLLGAATVPTLMNKCAHLAVRLRKDRDICTPLDRNPVIYDDGFPATLLAAVELHDVAAARVVLHRLEDVLDGAGKLGQACERGHQPTVAKLPLADIAGLNLPREQSNVLHCVRLAAGDLRDAADLVASLPFDLLVNFFCRLILPLANRRGRRRELRVVVFVTAAHGGLARAGAVAEAQHLLADEQPELAARPERVRNAARQYVDPEAVVQQHEREADVPAPANRSLYQMCVR